jgi:NDP-sugar pyrophosphorylase family protein
MRFAIISAGEGSRLANEGFNKPKPLVPICGIPMIERLIGIFMRSGATEIAVIINGDNPETVQFMQLLKNRYPIDLIVKRTQSSMHSLYELRHFLRDDKFCLTTVDTIFKEEQFFGFMDAFKSLDSSGLMGVTDFVDDEKPLFVGTNQDMDIVGFYDEPNECKFVSAGVYALPSSAIEVLEKCVESGQTRMRNFQRQLIADEIHLKAYSLGRVVDVDHVSDISVAESLLQNHN